MQRVGHVDHVQLQETDRCQAKRHGNCRVAQQYASPASEQGWRLRGSSVRNLSLMTMCGSRPSLHTSAC